MRSWRSWSRSRARVIRTRHPRCSRNKRPAAHLNSECRSQDAEVRMQKSGCRGARHGPSAFCILNSELQIALLINPLKLLLAVGRDPCSQRPGLPLLEGHAVLDALDCLLDRSLGRRDRVLLEEGADVAGTFS